VSWLKLDDGFADHPKLVQMSPADRWAWLEVLLYCSRHRTDGVVNLAVLERYGFDDAGVTWLFELGLLDEPSNAEGGRTSTMVVHDWAAYNGGRSGAERTAAWRDRKYGEDRSHEKGGKRGRYVKSDSGDVTPSSRDRLYARAPRAGEVGLEVENELGSNEPGEKDSRELLSTERARDERELAAEQAELERDRRQQAELEEPE
jgi:hypothetical protein